MSARSCRSQAQQARRRTATRRAPIRRAAHCRRRPRPHFDANGNARFRDRQPFPWHTLSSAGQGPVNARLLWEAGLVSYGYGTDTQWPPKETLADELRALRLVFSPQDVVKIITKNAANATLHGAEIGTLEVGKLADIVIIDGDPMRDSSTLLNVVTTIKGGQVVFEKKN